MCPSTNLLVFNGITGKLQRLDTLCQRLLGHTLKHWLLQWTSHQQLLSTTAVKPPNNPSRKIVYSTLKRYSTNLTLRIKQIDNTRALHCTIHFQLVKYLNAAVEFWEAEQRSPDSWVPHGMHVDCCQTLLSPSALHMPSFSPCLLRVSLQGCRNITLWKRVEEGWVRWKEK